jgi:hypothetical protein
VRGQLAARSDEPAFVPYQPVRLFSDRARAEAFRAELERAARLAACPFELLLGTGVVQLTDAWLCDLVVGLGLPEPRWTSTRVGRQTLRSIDWPLWWRETAPALTDEQIGRVWGLFDNVELTRVVPMMIEA